MGSVSLGTRLGVKRAGGVAALLLIGAGACGCSSRVSVGDLGGRPTELGSAGNDAHPGDSGGTFATSAGGDVSRGVPGSINIGGADGFGMPTAPSENGTGETGTGGPGPLCPMQACVPSVPAGWLGPIAAWEGRADAHEAPPDCPAGYAKPIDLHRELDAPAGACTCTCTAQGQVCNENTMLEIFADPRCEAARCALALPDTCTAVLGCSGSQGSVRALIPGPSGGSCQASISPPAVAAWQYDIRLCQPNTAGDCEDPGQICVPPAASPYLTPLCVMRVVPEGQALPACPTAYPNAREASYASFNDSRGCSDCGCGDVTGGSCAGQLMISGDSKCSSGVPYSLGSGCRPFDLGSVDSQLSSVGVQYALTNGTCGVASASHPTGSAAPTGQITALCCQ